MGLSVVPGLPKMCSTPWAIKLSMKTCLPRMPVGSPSALGRGGRTVHQVLGARLDPRKEARHEGTHAHLRVALYVGEGDQRPRHAAGLHDLGDRVVDGALDVGMAEVADVPHGGGEIARGHEESVDVVDAQDLVQVLDGHDVLEEHDEETLVVGGLEIVAHSEALAAREHAALADGRELARLYHRLRLRLRV